MPSAAHTGQAGKGTAPLALSGRPPRADTEADAPSTATHSIHWHTEPAGITPGGYRHDWTSDVVRPSNYTGKAVINPDDPRAVGICSRCGNLYDLRQLR